MLFVVNDVDVACNKVLYLQCDLLGVVLLPGEMSRGSPSLSKGRKIKPPVPCRGLFRCVSVSHNDFQGNSALVATAGKGGTTP